MSSPASPPATGQKWSHVLFIMIDSIAALPHPIASLPGGEDAEQHHANPDADCQAAIHPYDTKHLHSPLPKEFVKRRFLRAGTIERMVIAPINGLRFNLDDFRVHTVIGIVNILDFNCDTFRTELIMVNDEQFNFMYLDIHHETPIPTGIIVVMSDPPRGDWGEPDLVPTPL
jgi:hypothetical protein